MGCCVPATSRCECSICISITRFARRKHRSAVGSARSTSIPRRILFIAARSFAITLSAAAWCSCDSNSAAAARVTTQDSYLFTKADNSATKVTVGRFSSAKWWRFKVAGLEIPSCSSGKRNVVIGETSWEGITVAWIRCSPSDPRHSAAHPCPTANRRRWR